MSDWGGEPVNHIAQTPETLKLQYGRLGLESPYDESFLMDVAIEERFTTIISVAGRNHTRDEALAAHATQIDPNRETAWRYWSDVLQKNGRLEEGGRMAIEAIIAEPYARLARAGIRVTAGNGRARGSTASARRRASTTAARSA